MRAPSIRVESAPREASPSPFHRAMGFRLVDGPGTREIMGVPAFPDYDYPGEDRVVFARALPTGR